MDQLEEDQENKKQAFAKQPQDPHPWKRKGESLESSS